MKWFGAAILAVSLTAGGAATSCAADAASAETRKAQAEHLRTGSVWHFRLYRDHYAYWPSHDARYFGRPYSYAPAPFVPLPPLFGYGWEP
jgi:hypothetical protein